MQPREIIAAGPPNTAFERWVYRLRRVGINAKQISIADYDAEDGYRPKLHPRGKEVYIVVPVEKLEEAVSIILAKKSSEPASTGLPATGGPQPGNANFPIGPSASEEQNTAEAASAEELEPLPPMPPPIVQEKAFFDRLARIDHRPYGRR